MEIFNVELPKNTLLDKVEIEVINLAGKLVKCETKRGINGLIINIDTAPAGVYFVNVRNGEFSSTKKLIKH